MGREWVRAPRESRFGLSHDYSIRIGLSPSTAYRVWIEKMKRLGASEVDVA